MEDKTIWGIHAGRTAEAEPLFLEKNVIALGWANLGDLSNLVDREQFKEHYASFYQDASSQSVATTAGQLYRFVLEVGVGDIVVYPGRIDRQVHIGEVSGDYAYQPDIDDHFVNQRPVKWLKHIPRTRFSQAALYEMGSAMSLFQIKNNSDEILAVLEGVAPDVIAASEDAIADVAEIEEQTKDFVLKELERSLKGLPLEEFIKHLLERMGYRARLTKPNEPSVDVIAHKDELGFEPPVIKVQVKSSMSKISDKDVSALYGKVESGEFGLLVTLGEYTPPAISFANTKSNLRLIDGGELVNLIFEYYEDFDPKYKGIIPLKRVYVPQSLESDD